MASLSIEPGLVKPSDARQLAKRLNTFVTGEKAPSAPVFEVDAAGVSLRTGGGYGTVAMVRDRRSWRERSRISCQRRDATRSEK